MIDVEVDDDDDDDDDDDNNNNNNNNNNNAVEIRERMNFLHLERRKFPS
jgi:hypothetical protein